MSYRCFVSTMALALLGPACGLQEYDHRPASATVVAHDAGRGRADAPNAGGSTGGSGGAPEGSGGQAGSTADGSTDPDPTPGDPGPGVTIDGQFVPRARAVVFLH